MGLGTWKADGDREDTDIVLLHREISTKFNKTRLLVEEVLGCETYAAKNDGCKRLKRKPIGQDELKTHLWKALRTSPSVRSKFKDSCQ